MALCGLGGLRRLVGVSGFRYMEYRAVEAYLGIPPAGLDWVFAHAGLAHTPSASARLGRRPGPAHRSMEVGLFCGLCPPGAFVLICFRSLGSGVPDVWLRGHSYVFWAAQRAESRPGVRGEALGARGGRQFSMRFCPWPSYFAHSCRYLWRSCLPSGGRTLKGLV